MEQMIKSCQANNCQYHVNKKRKIFCVTCQDAFCLECIALSHVGHKRKNIQDQCKDNVKRLRVALDNLNSISDDIDLARVNYHDKYQKNNLEDFYCHLQTSYAK